MRADTRMLLVASLLLAPAPSVLAQAGVDPSGHWEGAVQLPNMAVTVEVDLTKNSKGELAGTFSQPAENVKGLPLSTVANVSFGRYTPRFAFGVPEFQTILCMEAAGVDGIGHDARAVGRHTIELLEMSLYHAAVDDDDRTMVVQILLIVWLPIAPILAGVIWRRMAPPLFGNYGMATLLTPG